MIPLFPQEATQTEKKKKSELSKVAHLGVAVQDTNPEVPDCTLSALYRVHFKLDAAADQGRGDSPDGGWD